jgi:hypothetical protein
MPFGDGTGPRGMGPMTGRRAGYCAGFGQPGFANPLPGRGWFGFGWGRRYGYPYAAAPYSAWPWWGGRRGGWGRGWRWFTPYWYPRW